MKQINFQITGNCNMYCKFCSDVVSYQKESSIEDIKKTIHRLIELGLQKIHITGGEPLLYKDLIEVLEYMKENNLEVSLSTNGTLLFLKKEVLHYIDEIVLPLDGAFSNTLTELGREKNQLIHTIQNICRIKEEYPQIRIKVSTVLCMKNVEELKVLVAIISHLAIDEWEVHQFLPHGRGKKNIQEFLLDDQAFERQSLFLQTTSIGEKIRTISVHNKMQAEWIITPALYLIKLKAENARFYGNIEETHDQFIKEIMDNGSQYTK